MASFVLPEVGEREGTNLCITANLRFWHSAGDFSVFSQKGRLGFLVRNRKVVRRVIR